MRLNTPTGKCLDTKLHCGLDRTTTGSTDNKFGRQDQAFFNRFAVDQANQVADCFTPDLFERGTDGGEGRGQDAGEAGIVEASHGHVFRDARPASRRA